MGVHVDELSSRATELGKTVAGLQARRDEVTKKKESLEGQVSKLEATGEILGQTVEVLNKLARASKEDLDRMVEGLLTHAVTSVWGDGYEFKVVTTEKRGTTADELVLMKNGKSVPIMEGHGGGVVNVVAFVLRLIFILKSKRPMRKIVFLDEPFSYVSAGLQPAVGELLRELTRKLQIDFVIVSHLDTIQRYADRVYEMKHDSSLGGVVAREVRLVE